MTKIKFSFEQRAAITAKIQHYVEQELAIELGQFDAEFLLDFFAQEIGHYFYNQALLDAQIILDQKMDIISDALVELERPVDP